MKLLIPRCLLCSLLLCVASPAQVQGPDLAITNFSVWSTLPGTDGQRRVSISFRVTNTGNAATTATTTNVTMAGSTTPYATPALIPGATVYFTQGLETTATQVPINIESNVQQHLIKGSDIKLQNPGAGSGEVQPNGPSNTMTYTANPAGDFGRWESIGPSKITTNSGSTGQVLVLAVSPTSPNVLYAGGRDSGLWKTSSDTPMWFPITDALPTLEIDAVALDPQDPHRVMVATPAGVFQSLDGGAMWVQLTSQNLQAVGSNGGALLIANAPGSPIYVSTLNGVQLSTDGGVTWNPVLASKAIVISLQFGTKDATQMFASTALPPAVYEAVNGGLSPTSWHQLQGCPGARLPSFPPAASVWVAESQGQQWVSFRGKMTDSPDLGLWRSTSETCNIDGFTEHGWEKVNLSGDCSKFTNHWSYLFAHPQDPTLVFKSGIDLCRSTASGDHLGVVPESQIHVDHHAIVVPSSSPSLMYFASDGGVYRSTNKGANISFIGEGMTNTEVLKIDVNGAASPRIIVGGSQDNDSFGWDGDSPVWTDIGPAVESGDVPLVAFSRYDHKGVYVMGQSTQAIDYHPPDSGGSWSEGNWSDCYAYSEFPGQVYLGMESTGKVPVLLVTCGGLWSGVPWKQIKLPPAQDSFVRLHLAPVNPEIAVAGTQNGHVFWGVALKPAALYDVFTAPNSGYVSAIAMASETTFYVANSVSDIGGNTLSPDGFGSGIITRFSCFFGCMTESMWPPPQSQLPQGYVTALGVDPLGTTETVLAAIQGAGIYQGTRSSAGVWTWVPYSNGIPIGANITDIEARKDGSIAASAYGRGVFLLTSRSTAAPPPTCASGLALCSGNCVDTQSDPLNCGGCGNACKTPRLNCVEGNCTVCPSGTQSCCGGEFCRKTCPICP